MARMKVQFDLEGVPDLQRAVTELGGKKIKAILRNAVSFSTTPIVSAAKRGAPRDTGQLKLSIGRVVRSYPSGTVVGVVGAAMGFRGHFMNKRGQLVLRNPVKYAHLVEYGHRVVHGGKLDRSKYKSELVRSEGRITGIVSPRPFMQHAYISTESQVQSRLSSKIAEGLWKAGA